MANNIETGNSERIECGTYGSWADAFGKITALVQSDKPEYIAAVSEEEFATGVWYASPLNAAPLPIIQGMITQIYPTDSIRILLDEITVAGRTVNQIIAVYTRKA
jgi:hypothetical protein